jgi:hypothetical protein
LPVHELILDYSHGNLAAQQRVSSSTSAETEIEDSPENI